MDKKTTSTKAWIGGFVSAGVSGVLPIIERWLMVDFPLEVETSIIAAVTGIATAFFVWRFPNREIPEATEGEVIQ